MLKDSTYDLMEAATVISKGRSRYETFKKNAKECPHFDREAVAKSAA